MKQYSSCAQNALMNPEIGAYLDRVKLIHPTREAWIHIVRATPQIGSLFSDHDLELWAKRHFLQEEKTQ